MYTKYWCENVLNFEYSLVKHITGNIYICTHIYTYMYECLVCMVRTYFYLGQGCSNGAIRLSDNSSVSYELCVTEFWDTIYFSDTICENNWSLKNSLVVCKQLGYHDAWTHARFR